MPRDRAQRRLPSMMMATCSGGAVGTGPMQRPCIALDQTCMMSFSFGRQQLVDALDVLVRQLLDLVRPVLVLVLRDVAVLFQPLELVHAVAADVADRDPGLLGVAVRRP